MRQGWITLLSLSAFVAVTFFAAVAFAQAGGAVDSDLLAMGTKLLVALGFEPALAAQAFVSFPLVRYAGMPIAQKLDFIPKHYEKMVGMGVTALLNAAFAGASGVAKPVPAFAAGAVGALFAIWWFDFKNKREAPAALTEPTKGA